MFFEASLRRITNDIECFNGFDGSQSIHTHKYKNIDNNRIATCLNIYTKIERNKSTIVR